MDSATTVNGLATFTGGILAKTTAVEIQSATTLAATTVGGLATFTGGILAKTTAVEIESALTTAATTVGGLATFTGGILAKTAAVNVESALTTAATTVGGLATFTGGILAKTAAVTIESATTVSGLATFTGGIISTGLITVTNAGGLNVAATVTCTGLSSTGTVTASGAALTSDRRFKNHIKPLQFSPLETITKLKGVQYEWRTEEFPERNFDNHTHYGFIAQEVEEVLPGIVGTDDTEDQYKALRYMGFTPILVEAVKEQQMEIDKLKSQVDLLTKFICTSELLAEGAAEVCSDFNNPVS